MWRGSCLLMQRAAASRHKGPGAAAGRSSGAQKLHGAPEVSPSSTGVAREGGPQDQSPDPGQVTFTEPEGGGTRPSRRWSTRQRSREDKQERRRGRPAGLGSGQRRRSWSCQHTGGGRTSHRRKLPRVKAGDCLGTTHPRRRGNLRQREGAERPGAEATPTTRPEACTDCLL